MPDAAQEVSFPVILAGCGNPGVAGFWAFVDDGLGKHDMRLPDVRKIEISDKIHFRDPHGVRGVGWGLIGRIFGIPDFKYKGMIPVRELAGRHFAFPINAESSAVGELAVGKQIFLFLRKNISERIFNRNPVNKKTYFNICGPVLGEE